MPTVDAPHGSIAADGLLHVQDPLHAAGYDLRVVTVRVYYNVDTRVAGGLADDLVHDGQDHRRELRVLEDRLLPRCAAAHAIGGVAVEEEQVAIVDDFVPQLWRVAYRTDRRGAFGGRDESDAAWIDRLTYSWWWSRNTTGDDLR